jgi:transposase InsO family protein
MEKYRSEFRVVKMAKVLDVSKSGFYAYLNRPKSKREIANDELLKKIKAIHKRSHGIYGYPNITKELEEHGAPSKNRVYRLMRKNGIKSKTVRKFKATTNSNHNLPVAENLLNREFTAEKPNQKWVSDITYIATDEGWLYLAGVMDLCGRAIVGFSMDNHMRKSLVIRALNQAVGRTGAKEGLLVHSDRGVQYASKEYQNVLKKNKFIFSMSRKGNCYDNAPMESFWGKLKQEWLYGRRFKTRTEAKAAIFEYIEVFYNRQRIHSSNGYRVPMDAFKVA